MKTTMENEFMVTIYVQPGAKKSEVCGMHNGNIKIKLNSPPVDGKANAALIHFLSNFLNIPKSSIELISGQKSRIKKLKIMGVSENIVTQALFKTALDGDKIVK